MSVVEGERRIPVGPLAGMAGALLVLVSLFVDWWEGATAFTAFEVLDLVLAALAIACLVAHAGAFGARVPGFDPSPGLTLAVGALAFVIVVSQTVNDPPAIVGSGLAAAAGIWLALGGSFLMLAGGVLTFARIAIAVDPGGERVSRRPGGPVAETPREPAAARMRRRAAERARAAAAAEREPSTPAAATPEPPASAAAAPEPEPPASAGRTPAAAAPEPARPPAPAPEPPTAPVVDDGPER